MDAAALAAGDVVAGEGVFIMSVFGLSGKPARLPRGWLIKAMSPG